MGRSTAVNMERMSVPDKDHVPEDSGNGNAKQPDATGSVVDTDTEVDELVLSLQAHVLSDVLPYELLSRNLDSDERTTMKLLRQGGRLNRGLVTPRVFLPAIIFLALAAGILIIFTDASGKA